MNIMLIGLGPHAKRIYIKFLKEENIVPKLVIDLKSKEKSINQFLKEYDVINKYYIDDKFKNELELPENVKNDLKVIIQKLNITHAIISTEPKSHFAYAKFLLENNINILMDKPITAPMDVVTNLKQVVKIKEEYKKLCELYKKAKLLNPKLIFSIQCQRRFHKGYQYIKNLISETISKYNIPISYIDIYHSDGMWNMPNEFLTRENHPYKYGYGKLFHSGYHFFDLLTWLLEENNKLKSKKISKASIYSEIYTPSDFIYNFNKDDYKLFFQTNKFDEIMQNNNTFKGYGELDYHGLIKFSSNENRSVTICSMNLLQSGFSRRAWLELPEDTYKGNGRVRHERINIQIGPLMNIQVHSYQAYEIKERLKKGGDNIGELEHFDILIFRNADLIEGKAFEKIKGSELYGKCDNKKFIGFNEEARKKCFDDFINNIENQSNILLHKQSVDILEKAYESIIFGGKKMEFKIDLEKQKGIENIIRVSDKDFNIEEKIHNESPITRFGARGIVINEDGDIAVIHKEKKNEYKLPGGGIEKGEDASDAFKRECEEEIGTKVEIKELLGTAEEYKSQENFKQLSFVFVANKTIELDSNKLTKKEKDEGTKYLWMNKTEVLDKMKSSLKELKASEYDNVYRTKFMVLRDIKILEYYINNYKN